MLRYYIYTILYNKVIYNKGKSSKIVNIFEHYYYFYINIIIFIKKYSKIRQFLNLTFFTTPSHLEKIKKKGWMKERDTRT